LPGLPEKNVLGRDDILTSRLADVANQDASFRERLFTLTSLALSQPRKKLLAQVLAKINDDAALLHALNLLDDQAPGTLPYEVYKQIEHAFVEHKPSGESTNAYTLAPRSANALRRKLVQMTATDERRTNSALSLLTQAEEWRLEYGRPAGELRNPVLGSGIRWPPAKPEELHTLGAQPSAGGRVLILGKDTGGGLRRLQQIQRKLVDLGYDPVLIKEQPDQVGESLIQKVLRFATASRFVLLDNTEASGHLYELPHVFKSAECITAVLQEHDKGSTWMMEDTYFRSNHLKKFEFHGDSIDSTVEQAVAWAEDFRKRFGDHQVKVLPWLK
jgi:hypothetical protein